MSAHRSIMNNNRLDNHEQVKPKLITMLLLKPKSSLTLINTMLMSQSQIVKHRLITILLLKPKPINNVV